MVNAWSLLHSEMNGTMDEDYPIMSKDDDVTIVGGDGDDTISITGSGLVGGADTVSIDWGYGGEDHISFGASSADTLNIGTPIPGAAAPDMIDFSGIAGTQYDDPKYYYTGLEYPDGLYSYYNPDTKPKPNLNLASTQKYQEDKGI